MKEIVNLENHKFNMLTVLYRIDDYVSPSGIKMRRWRCKCDCGNEIDVRESCLKNNNTKSCGCYRKDASSKQLKDLTGLTYGDLVVIERAEDHVTSGGNKIRMWKCKCSCGQNKVVYASQLTSGLITSCGCKSDEKRKLNHIEKVKKSKKTLINMAPHLAREWDYNNNVLNPNEVSPNNNSKVAWIGKCGHRWKATISSRYKGAGCPYCANVKILPGFNDLFTKNPQLKSEWNYDKNDGVAVDRISSSSKTKYWWKCSSGHEWKSSVQNRTQGANCPYCSEKYKTYGVNDYATKYPELLNSWDFEKNGQMQLAKMNSITTQKVWWVCDLQHSFQATIQDKLKYKCGCPYCSGEWVLDGYNDIETTHRNIAQEWNYDKNDNLKPSMFSKGSSKKVWWVCNKGHEWKASISSRIHMKSGCPICSKELKTSFPEQAIYYYVKQYYPNAINTYVAFGYELDVYIPEKDIAIEYDGIKWHTGKLEKELKKNQLCANNGIKLIRVREDGLECFDDCICFIRKEKDKLSSLNDVIRELLEYLQIKIIDVDVERDNIDILELFRIRVQENSLEKRFPKIAKQWHPTKNGKLVPDFFSSKSEKKVWWLGDCGHEWKTSISVRTCGNDYPYCSNHKLLKGFNDLETRYPDIAKEWHPVLNGSIKPCDVISASKEKSWWICPEGHEYQMLAYNRIKRNSGCPICLGRKIVRGINDFATLNPELLEEWNYEKNSIDPYSVANQSNIKVWWKCNKGHEWETAICLRTGRGNGCPQCRCKSVINIETGEIFKSISDAARKHNIAKTNIIKCCKDSSKTCSGYHWRYFNEVNDN